ncbi:lysine-specific demethylase 8 [Phlebotomus papatasi]|uniref:lysine-specific demethylase 8 n=1 Tax=Phlebotomus papatasi TaxID=29031 RepID=UPI0024837072|nr:lysine-specific demethylase 8 [Phlebotomus papatasi]
MSVQEIFSKHLPRVEEIIEENCDELHKFVFNSAILSIKRSQEDSGTSSESLGMEFQENICTISALRTFTWEMLHIGHWNKVAIGQRINYSLATFLEVFLNLQIRNNPENLIAWLEELDTGILLGAPILSQNGQDILKTCASSISEEISLRQEPQSFPMTCKIQPSPSHGVTTRKIPIDTLELPSIQEFREKFFLPQIPVLIQNCIEHWPARAKWSDLGYFIQRFGYRTVPIEIGSQYTESNWGQKLVRLKDFIDRQFISRKNDTIVEYLAQHDLLNQIPELQEDIRIPDYCYISSPDNEVKSEVEVKIWFGPWGTVSPLHFDKKHNLLAQLVGTKRLLLADPKDSEDVYPFAGEMLSNTSQVDLENVDELQFPNIKNVSFHEIILNSGEMLYIPPGWWHHVRALSNSISISFWWEDKIQSL